MTLGWDFRIFHGDDGGFGNWFWGMGTSIEEPEHDIFTHVLDVKVFGTITSGFKLGVSFLTSDKFESSSGGPWWSGRVVHGRNGFDFFGSNGRAEDTDEASLTMFLWNVAKLELDPSRTVDGRCVQIQIVSINSKDEKQHQRH